MQIKVGIINDFPAGPVVVLCRTSLPVSFFSSYLGLSKRVCQMRPSRCQGTACALRRSSSACDSLGPIRRMTNRPRLSEKLGLFEEKIQCRKQRQVRMFAAVSPRRLRPSRKE